MINLLNIQREKLVGSELLCFLSSSCRSCLINNSCDVNFHLTQMTNKKAWFTLFLKYRFIHSLAEKLWSLIPPGKHKYSIINIEFLEGWSVLLISAAACWPCHMLQQQNIENWASSISAYTKWTCSIPVRSWYMNCLWPAVTASLPHWRSSTLNTLFMQCFGNCLFCICERESLIFPVQACMETSAAWQTQCRLAGEPGFPGLCPLLPQRSWVPLRFTATLCLKFSSMSHWGYLCFLHLSMEHTSTPLREWNVLEEKEKKDLVQSWRDFGPDYSLSADGQGPAFLGVQGAEQGAGVLGW